MSTEVLAGLNVKGTLVSLFPDIKDLGSANVSLDDIRDRKIAIVRAQKTMAQEALARSETEGTSVGSSSGGTQVPAGRRVVLTRAPTISTPTAEALVRQQTTASVMVADAQLAGANVAYETRKREVSVETKWSGL